MKVIAWKLLSCLMLVALHIIDVLHETDSTKLITQQGRDLHLQGVPPLHTKISKSH
jgi:hypothetical protein